MTCRTGLFAFAAIMQHIDVWIQGKITIELNPGKSGLMKSIGNANDALFLRSNRMSIWAQNISLTQWLMSAEWFVFCIFFFNWFWCELINVYDWSDSVCFAVFGQMWRPIVVWLDSICLHYYFGHPSPWSLPPNSTHIAIIRKLHFNLNPRRTLRIRIRTF